jgi:site-specific DNA-cytosine methylase
MADLGYSVAWRVLDAQYFGVPQRRKRVFIACRRASSGSAGEILFKPEGVRRDSTQSKPQREDLATSTAESVGRPVLYADKVNTLQARDYKGVGNQYVTENKLVVHQE